MDVMPRTLRTACAVAAVLLVGACTANEVEGDRGDGASERGEPLGDLLQGTAGTDFTYQREAAIKADVADDSGETSGGNLMTGDVKVVVSNPARGELNALGGGRLEVVGGCLGASGSVVVWPNGTTVVQDEPLTIDIPDYGRFSLGDNVRLGGGYVLEHSSDDVAPGDYPVGGVRVPAECAKHDIFVAN
jgi:hypothetical protein